MAFLLSLVSCCSSADEVEEDSDSASFFFSMSYKSFNSLNYDTDAEKDTGAASGFLGTAAYGLRPSGGGMLSFLTSFFSANLDLMN